MRYIFLILIIGCAKIEELKPNQTSSFLKFYSETNKMEGKDLIVLNDGFLILATYEKTATLVLKTDGDGNKLWAKPFINFIGNSFITTSDGYIIIGDSVSPEETTTYMKLIKIDINGNNSRTKMLGDTFKHGTTLLETSANEIVVLGFNTSPEGNRYSTMMGFNADFTDAWSHQRDYAISGKSRYPSKLMYETENGDIAWMSYSLVNEENPKLNFIRVPPDSETLNSHTPLFSANELSNMNGEIVKNKVGYTVAQTLQVGNESKIGISDGFHEVILNEGEFENGNFLSASITDTENALIIAASTDRHTSPNRTDMDLLLLEVNYNGTLKKGGINSIFGGIGNELPVRIRKVDDGYAVLGTLINSKDGQQIFLLKTNKKGTLD